MKKYDAKVNLVNIIEILIGRLALLILGSLAILGIIGGIRMVY